MYNIQNPPFGGFFVVMAAWNLLPLLSFEIVTCAKEAIMDIELLAQNDALQNKNMANNPDWTLQERQRYQAAYMSAKQKIVTGPDVV